MGTLFNAKDFVDKLKDVATNTKTIYILGCFGAPMNLKNKKRYENNNDFNKGRTPMIEACTPDTFGFDCVGLVKGILWGWNKDISKTYGGATYRANDVPDVGANTMIKLCTEVSTNFGNIRIGEFVWMDGHCGVYIGDGLAIECTPKWENKVQITAVGNIGKKNGYNTRTWTKHGKLPWIDYTSNVDNVEAAHSNNTTNASIIKYTVKRGDTLWGIAKALLGSGTRYKEIMSLNGLKTQRILPNQVLKIPKKGW